jgi:hypothetical protein
MSSLMAVQSAIADPSVKDLAARTEQVVPQSELITAARRLLDMK